MLAVLRRPAARRACAALAAVLAFAVAVALPASAEYATVRDGLTQWVWARAAHETAPPMTAVAVRPDGALVVATSPDQRRARDFRLEGGELHLIRSQGEVVSKRNQLGPTRFGFHRLVVRNGRLYGLSTTSDDVDEIGQRARLFELDINTGAVLRDLGVWWWPDLTVDPVTGDLVLYDFRCTGRCTGTNEQAGTITHPLVRFNPDTGRKETILPDPMTADIGGSSTCFARRESSARCEEVWRLAFSPDGSRLYLATARNGRNVVDVRDRSGAVVGQVEIPRPADSIAHAADGSCLGGAVLISSSDGTVTAVRNTSVQVVAAGAPPGVSATTIDGDGRLVTSRRTEVGVLSCPGLPAPPAVAPPSAPTPPPEHLSASTAASPTPGGGAPAAAVTNPPPPPPPATPPPATPVAAGPPAHGAQAATAPGAGLADAPEEQPVYGLSASAVSALPPAWASLGVSAVALLMVAGATFLLLEPRTTRLMPLARLDPER